MKKLMVLLSAFLLVFGIAGVANAKMYTDFFNNSDSTDYQYFPSWGWGGTQLGTGDSLGWWFDIYQDGSGFDPSTEVIGSARVEMTIRNYGDQRETETAVLTVGTAGWWYDYKNEFSYDLYADLWGTPNVYVGTLYVLGGLQDDGMIYATLTAGGDSSFWFNEATLYAETVPEPATMLLLGTGIVGLAGMRRKKFSNK